MSGPSWVCVCVYWLQDSCIHLPCVHCSWTNEFPIQISPANVRARPQFSRQQLMLMMNSHKSFLKPSQTGCQAVSKPNAIASTMRPVALYRCNGAGFLCPWLACKTNHNRGLQSHNAHVWRLRMVWDCDCAFSHNKDGIVCVYGKKWDEVRGRLNENFMVSGIGVN